MYKEILIGVSSSLVGAFIAFSVGASFSIIKTNINDKQLEQIATKLITVDSNMKTILKRMDETKKFKGPTGSKGDTGEKGEKGDPGYNGVTDVEVVKYFGVGNHNARQTISLGNFDACFLVTVNERDGGDTACIISESNNSWSLYASYADCGAVCLKFNMN